MCRHMLCEHTAVSCSLSPAPPSLLRDLSLALLSPPILLAFTCGLLYVSPPPLHVTLTNMLLFFFVLLVCIMPVLLYNYYFSPDTQLSSAERQRLHNSESSSQIRNHLQKQRTTMAEHLGGAIRFKTISYDKDDEKNRADDVEFHGLNQYLRRTFPLVYSTMKVVNLSHSLILEWCPPSTSITSDSSSPLPILLTGHMDVVPPGPPSLWEFEPFCGSVTDTHVLGRGAIDDKQAVVGILEACTYLIQQGFQPSRRIFIAFGHDEEVTGEQGAANIAKYFQQHNLRFEFMLDEGLFVMSQMLPGLSSPLAMVCTSEKGFLITRLHVEVEPKSAGHSSAPANESAIGILAKAMINMEKHKMPSYLDDGPVKHMFTSISRYFSPVYRVIFSNLWLFSPLLKRLLSAKSTTATTVRTTTALTVFHAGNKANVLPRVAEARINHRIHFRDSVSGVLSYTSAVIDDARVKVENISSLPPAPLSSHESKGFHAIKEAIARTIPEALVAPALMVGNTDTHWYWSLCDDIYRFCPTRLNNESVSMFHGVNEKIHIDNFLEIIQFYIELITVSNQNQASGNTSTSALQPPKSKKKSKKSD